MGLSQSSRTLTVTNDNTRIIKLSESLVERLATQTQSQGESSATATASLEPTAAVKKASPSSAAPVVASSSSSSSNVFKPAPAAPQLPGYTMSALEMHQQKEREIANQEQYWQQRVRAIEQNHAKIDQIFQDEYKKAVDEFANTKGAMLRRAFITLRYCPLFPFKLE